MKSVWHIAEKDLRRLRWPVAGWLAFVVAGAIWVRCVSPAAGAADYDSLVTAITSLQGFTTVWRSIELLTVYLLAGALVLEDPVDSTTAFWLTRPIGGATLLGAKVLAGTVLFAVLPALVLSPVWVWSGFSLEQWATASGSITALFGMVALLGMAVASLVRNIGAFVVGSLLLTVLFSLCTARATFVRFQEDIDADLWRSSSVVVQWTFLIGLVAIGVSQFISRRTPLGKVALATLLLLLVEIRVAWPWNFGAFTRDEIEPPVTALPSIAVERIVGTPNAGMHAVLSVPLGGRAEEMVAPVWGETEASHGDERAVFVFKADRTWGTEALRQVWGYAKSTSIGWQLAARRLDGPLSAPGSNAPRSSVLVERVLARRCAELPLVDSAGAACGATQTRIIRVGADEEGHRWVTIEVRMAGRVADLVSPIAPRTEPWNADVFALVDTQAKTVEPVQAQQVGDVSLNGVKINVLRLTLPAKDAHRETIEKLAWVHFDVIDKWRQPLLLKREGVAEEVWP